MAVVAAATVAAAAAVAARSPPHPSRVVSRAGFPPEPPVPTFAIATPSTLPASPAVREVSSARPWGIAVLTTLVFVIAALQSFGFHDLRHDDAYITFRYSANLANGHGLVFNVGERVMGSTSPGLALLGALVHEVVGHRWLPTAMSIVGCVGWALQAAALLILLRPVVGVASARFVAAAIAAGAAWSHRYVALETNLLVACVLWSLVMVRHGRWHGGAILTGIAVLLRPDAAILAALLTLAAFRARGRAAVGPIALGALVAAPWFLFAWWYYGNPLPQSAHAKVASETMREYGQAALQYVTLNVLRPSLDVRFDSPNTWTLMGAVLAVGLVGASVLVRRSREMRILYGYGLALTAAYVVMRPRPGIEWHLYPALLIATISVLVAIAWTGRAVAARGGRKLALAGATAILAIVGLRTVQYATLHDHAFWYGARDEVYREVARYLDDHAVPGDEIMTIEAGTLAYYSGLSIFDLAGLVTREPDPNSTGPRWFVDVPAYPRFYGEPHAKPPFRKFESSAVTQRELHAAGEERFIALLEDRHATRDVRATNGAATPAGR